VESFSGSIAQPRTWRSSVTLVIYAMLVPNAKSFCLMAAHRFCVYPLCKKDTWRRRSVSARNKTFHNGISGLGNGRKRSFWNIGKNFTPRQELLPRLHLTHCLRSGRSPSDMVVHDIPWEAYGCFSAAEAGTLKASPPGPAPVPRGTFRDFIVSSPKY
jgi:hypothetical protein